MGYGHLHPEQARCRRTLNANATYHLPNHAPHRRRVCPRWKIASQQTERQASQQHFLDLCQLLKEPKPAEHDPTGETYCFERHVSKTKGGKGFADVWKRGHFAWEYKGKHKDLRGAYLQLQDYRVDLLNPPLLVVSDLDIIRVHTNFPNTQERAYEFNLDDLRNEQATAKSVLPPLDILRAIFNDFNVLRPNATAARVTEAAASNEHGGYSHAGRAEQEDGARPRKEHPPRARCSQVDSQYGLQVSIALF